MRKALFAVLMMFLVVSTPLVVMAIEQNDAIGVWRAHGSRCSGSRGCILTVTAIENDKPVGTLESNINTIALNGVIVKERGRWVMTLQGTFRTLYLHFDGRDALLLYIGETPDPAYRFIRQAVPPKMVTQQ